RLRRGFRTAEWPDRQAISAGAERTGNENEHEQLRRLRRPMRGLAVALMRNGIEIGVRFRIGKHGKLTRRDCTRGTSARTKLVRRLSLRSAWDPVSCGSQTAGDHLRARVERGPGRESATPPVKPMPGADAAGMHRRSPAA